MIKKSILNVCLTCFVFAPNKALFSIFASNCNISLVKIVFSHFSIILIKFLIIAFSICY